MKFILVAVFAGLCAVATATTYEEQGVRGVYTTPYKYGGKDYDVQYKRVLDLFKHVHQRTLNKEHVDIAKDFSIENNMVAYAKPEVVKEFLHFYHKGMLPRDEVFSVFYEYHLEQAIALFKMFYYANDFETFYKTAVWARYHVNQGMFLYTFSCALIHRHDTYTMELPPIYEIYPFYFFNTEVIHKVQMHKQMFNYAGVQEHAYLVHANYSGHYLNLHPERSMAYFTEDAGVNAYYYYYNLYRPFWMNSEEFGLNTYHRGEEFYYFYQQFLARFYLERLSNDMGEIKTFDYEDEFETGFHPTIRHHNGLPFSYRPNWAKFFTNYYNHKQSISMKGQFPHSYTLVKDYERRIREAIDFGYVYAANGTQIKIFEAKGFNILGNLIESNPHSVNTHFYGFLQVFARHLLGYSYQPLHEYKIAPSVLEHFETSLRDPAFWQLYKRIVMYFQKYKYQLAHYTVEDLFYPGVKVESIVVDRLVTFFEKYDFDVSNAAYLAQNEWEHNNFEVYARQFRLNHKPFNYKINVVSEKPTQAVVRVFIGPKYDEYGRFITIDENRMNFVEFDKFKYELKAGQNTIDRSSHDIFFKKDRTTYKQLYQHIMTGVHAAADEEYTTNNYAKQFHYAFPNRFLLPKGKHGGQTYQFYVIVTPFRPLVHHSKIHKFAAGYQNPHFKYPMVGLGVQHFDDYPLGYPFDRPIDETNFFVPNAFFQDVVIYHNHVNEITGAIQHDVTDYKGYGTQYQQPHNEEFEPKYTPGFETHQHQEFEPKYSHEFEPKYTPGFETHQHQEFEPKYSHEFEPKYTQGYENFQGYQSRGY